MDLDAIFGPEPGAEVPAEDEWLVIHCGPDRTTYFRRGSLAAFENWDYTFPAPAKLQPTWDAESVELINWFRLHRSRLPLKPFQWSLGVRVVLPERFYAALTRDLEAGPRGPRSQSGALRADLERLRRLCDEPAT